MACVASWHGCFTPVGLAARLGPQPLHPPSCCVTWPVQDATPDYDSFCMLGEAFMQIQEPEKAVRAFENALDSSPKELGLLLKVRACAHTCMHACMSTDMFKWVYVLTRHACVCGTGRCGDWGQVCAIYARVR